MLKLDLVAPALRERFEVASVDNADSLRAGLLSKAGPRGIASLNDLPTSGKTLRLGYFLLRHLGSNEIATGSILFLGFAV